MLTKREDTELSFEEELRLIVYSLLAVDPQKRLNAKQFNAEIAKLEKRASTQVSA